MGPLIRVIAVVAAALLLPLVAEAHVTCGGNNQRTSWNYEETRLTHGSVASGRFKRLWAVEFDSATYASPLYLEHIQLDGRTADVLIGVTTRNSIYAVDADSGNVIWSRLALDQAEEEEGSYSAPVFDPSTGSVFLLTRAVRAQVAHFKLWAFDVASGKERFAPVAINHEVVPGFPKAEISSRGGLLLHRRKIYVAFGGGKAEVSSQLYHGAIVEIDVLRPGAKPGVFFTTQEMRGGGIWGDCGLAVDSRGDLWAASSNCNGDISDYSASGRPNYCHSILSVELPFRREAAPKSVFTPPNVAWLDNTDQGFCTSPVVLSIKGSTYVAATNKDGFFYLVNAGDSTRSTFRMQGSRLFLCGQMAQFVADGTAYFYSMGRVSDANDTLGGVVAIRMRTNGTSIAELDPQVAWRTGQQGVATINGLYGTSRGTQEPIVWTVMVERAAAESKPVARLAAFNALDGTRLPLGGEGAEGKGLELPMARRYRAPTVAASRIFVPAHGIVAFGLLPP